jgi:quercetin dioxygenase-like cupin family protein
MKNRTLAKSLIGLLLFAVGLATGLLAQTNSPQRIEQKRADLIGAPGMEVIASTMEVKTGEGIELHTHPGIETVYVIQGAMIQAPGKDPMMLPTGATSLFQRDVKHAGFKVVGETPLKLFTVHIVDKGKPLYDYTK